MSRPIVCQIVTKLIFQLFPSDAFVLGTVSEGDPGSDHEFRSVRFGRHRRPKELVLSAEKNHGAQGEGASGLSLCMMHAGSPLVCCFQAVTREGMVSCHSFKETGHRHTRRILTNAVPMSFSDLRPLHRRRALDPRQQHLGTSNRSPKPWPRMP